MPEAYDLQELRSELLRPGGLWRRIDAVSATGSTNADLAAAARAGAEPGAVLLTDYQSAGRGRAGRSWTAPPGTSVAMSVLVRPALPESRWTWLPLLAGVAVAEGLRAETGIPAELKWPNDVRVADQKISGVLAERVATPTGAAAVVGVGINVDLPEAELPVASATSLALLQPERSHSRTGIVAAVLAALELELRRWEASVDDAGAAAAYTKLCSTVGRPVEVHVGRDQVVRGRAVRIELDGRLVVNTETGEQVFGAGDVVHLR